MKIVRRKIVIIVNIVSVKAQVLGTRLNHIIKLDTAPVSGFIPERSVFSQ